MCKVTYNETKCTCCKKLLKSEVEHTKCSQVLMSSYTSSNALEFQGCKEGQTSVTNTKEEGMCDACEAVKKDVEEMADRWRRPGGQFM